MWWGEVYCDEKFRVRSELVLGLEAVLIMA
jgi:hypothetical protein